MPLHPAFVPAEQHQDLSVVLAVPTVVRATKIVAAVVLVCRCHYQITMCGRLLVIMVSLVIDGSFVVWLPVEGAEGGGELLDKTRRREERNECEAAKTRITVQYNCVDGVSCCLWHYHTRTCCILRLPSALDFWGRRVWVMACWGGISAFCKKVVLN